MLHEHANLMNMKAQNELLQYFHNLGFELDFSLVNCKHPPFDYTVSINKETVWITVKKEIRPNSLVLMNYLFEHNEKTLLIAEYITPSAKEKLRNEKVNYIDSFGNAYLNLETLKIYIEKGNAKPIVKSTSEIVSVAGAKLIFEFLQNPEGINTKTYRELAEACNIALGSVSKIMKGLQNEGYIVQHKKAKLELIRREELLDRWVTIIIEKVLPTQKVGTYMFGKTKVSDWKDIQASVQWAGEPGAAILTNYLNPEKFSMFTDLSPKEIITEVGLLPDVNGNITIYKPFCKQKESSQKTVSPLLIYAQLVYDGNDRNLETAKMIFDEYIKPNL
jgi:hypothetical protein